MRNPDNPATSRARKAWRTRKGRKAAGKAHRTAQEAMKFTKNALRKKGYRWLSFESKRGYEYKGVVDLVAVRRDNKNPDKLEVVLVQVKGGTSRVGKDETRRLHDAADNLVVSPRIAEKSGRRVRFRELDS